MGRGSMVTMTVSSTSMMTPSFWFRERCDAGCHSTRAGHVHDDPVYAGFEVDAKFDVKHAAVRCNASYLPSMTMVTGASDTAVVVKERQPA